MSVEQAKEVIGPVEFLQWKLKILLDEEDVIKKEWEGRSRSDYYMAQIASEISSLHRSLVSIFTKPNWPALDTEKFLIQFQIGDTPPAPLPSKEMKQLPAKKDKPIEEMTPEEILAKKKEVSQRSRAAWGALLRLDPERDA